jgi:hypothetical protein
MIDVRRNPASTNTAVSGITLQAREPEVVALHHSRFADRRGRSPSWLARGPINQAADLSCSLNDFPRDKEWSPSRRRHDDSLAG